MFAKLSVGAMGLVLALLAALAGATGTSAQSPTPTPPQTATVTASPSPIPTRPAAPEPLPAGCAPAASPSPSAPNAPGGLSLVVVANPNLSDLPATVVVLGWTDNSADELCFAVERRVGDGPWEWLSAVQANQQGTYGDGFVGGAWQCYRVFAGNQAGRSDYSNVACVDLPPPLSTPTPTATASVAPPTAVPTATPPSRPPEPSFTPPPVTPSPPPWPCLPDVDPPYSELGPSAPTNLTAVLVADAAIPRRYVVRLAWQDNAEGESCYKVQKRDQAGTWRTFTTSGGSMATALDGQPGGDAPCYRVWAANENGRSDYSNEACATGPAVAITPTPVVTPTPAATRAVVVVPSGLPATGGGAGGVGPAWR